MLYQVPNGEREPSSVAIDNPLYVAIVQDIQSQRIQKKQGQPPVVVSTSVVTLIAAANPMRRSILLTNVTGTQLCYLDTNGQVSSTSYGTLLTGTVGSSVTFFTKDAIYGLSATAAQTIGVWEEEYVV